MCLVLLCLVSHLGRTSSRCRKRLLLLVLTQQQQNRPPRCSQAFDCDQKEARAAGQKQHNTRNVALILCDAASPHMIFFGFVGVVFVWLVVPFSCVLSVFCGCVGDGLLVFVCFREEKGGNENARRKSRHR